MSVLFSKLKLREIEFKNRVWVSPMCQYSSANGLPTDWHLVHLGSRAVGGAGLVVVEATAVSPVGRISPGDSGMWSDQHAEAFKRITDFIVSQGAVPAIQLAHAGRKGSTEAPWDGDASIPSSDERAWETLAPSPIPFRPGWHTPRQMNGDDMARVTEEFVMATKRSFTAGFQVVEIHMAHGYLLHEFLSPLSNTRNDEFGGSFENRARFPLAVAKAVRNAWPARLPVFARLSTTDWVPGGWTPEQSVTLASLLKTTGIDLIDCSSGGATHDAKIPVGPSYQVPFAEMIRSQAGIATAAVGMITEALQAEGIIRDGQADAVFLARAMLHDPYWPLHAAETLGAPAGWPQQYGRVRPRK
ncbi:MAG: NADH:flavin oxidoreductase/NADH oxidase [Pseudomonadota bacterium]|nr:NADH:flavin oxidoreductase/NADH oxidase [Pseudomonadota bacterium]